MYRMKKDPALYNISVEKLKEDPDLEQHRADLIHTAASLLEKCGLIKYDRKFGHLQVNVCLLLIFINFAM